MPLPPLSPDSPLLTLICGLGWPKMERYYMSRRYPGCWDFWVLGYRKRKARQLFARLDEASTSEDQVAFDALDFYLGTHRKMQHPEPGIFQEGLLCEPMIQTALEQHLERGKQKYGELYGGMLGMMWEMLNEDDYHELMGELAERHEPEKAPARVLPFPPKDSEDDGSVH